MSECSQLTTPIVEALTDAGYFAMRLNSGKVKVRGGWLSLCPCGTADILVCPPMRPPLWVETKAVKRDYHREQVEAQDAFRERVTRLGHGYVTARDLADVLRALESTEAAAEKGGSDGG
ncbi:MAG: hypothetical protein ACRD3N_01205 [Terracidiphilus sp.]